MVSGSRMYVGPIELMSEIPFYGNMIAIDKYKYKQGPIKGISEIHPGIKRRLISGCWQPEGSTIRSWSHPPQNIFTFLDYDCTLALPTYF